jgi:hypothetical protein
MPKERPKEKTAPTVETIKAEKSKVEETYEDFRKYAERYESIEKVVEALSPGSLDIKTIRQSPKYSEVFNKIVSLSNKGLSSLYLLKSIMIEKGMNLLKLKDRIKKISTNLKNTFQEWKKANTQLENIITTEKKRAELMVKLSEKTDNYLLNDDVYKTMTYETYVRVHHHILDHPKYKALEEKIKTASVDDLNAMYRNESIFNEVHELTKTIIKAEQVRQDLLLDLEMEPVAMCESQLHEYFKTQEQIGAATHALRQTEPYLQAEHLIKDSSPEQILELNEKREVLQNYWKQLELPAMIYANEERLERSLKPYLQLKPKGVSDEQFLSSLRRSNYYTEAFNAIQNGDLDQQKAFDPNKYFNFNQEYAIYIASRNGPDNLVKYAAGLAEAMVIKGKRIEDDYGLA